MNSNRRYVYILISWVGVLLWMLLIFNLSSQAAEQSDQLSKGIVGKIIELIDAVIPGHAFDMGGLNHIIRKNAHFIAYLVLGILVMNALKRSGFKGCKLAAIALGICVLYAVSDEVHQLFVPGRSGEIRDMLIDSAGAAVGIGIYKIVNSGNKTDKTTKMI